MRKSSDAWSTEKSYSIQKQLIWQKNHPVSYSRVRETLRIWSTQHSVQLMRNARPHKVFEEWSMCKTQTNKCFSKRNPMLNTGKVITNRSCLHSAYSSKLELPLPNSLDCKAGRWRSSKIMVYWQIWEGTDTVRHICSRQASEFKPHQPLNSPEFSPSKVGISALWRQRPWLTRPHSSAA